MPPTSTSTASSPTSSPLRVIIIMPLAELRGGGELSLMHLLRAGRDQGVEWIVVFLEDGPMVAQVRELGVNASVILSGRMRDVHRLLRASQKIARLARREKADLILGWMGTGQLYGGTASLMSGVPATWYQHGIPIDKSMIDRIATRLPTRLIMACSDAGADAQRQISPARRVYTISPAVDLDRFDPDTLPTVAECRRRLGLPLDVPIIGIVGRLQKWKGIHVLIEAMPAVLSRYPDARAVVVGGVHAFEPEYAEHVAQLVREKGLQDQVILAGLQSNVEEWMQAMDIVVHASDNEPFGMVIIEAMALGKPVIAGDKGGPTEIITEGVDGLLTPYGDAPALSTAIVRYLDDPEMQKRFGTAARARAQSFSTARYAREIIERCREALGGRGV